MILLLCQGRQNSAGARGRTTRSGHTAQPNHEGYAVKDAVRRIVRSSAGARQSLRRGNATTSLKNAPHTGVPHMSNHKTTKSAAFGHFMKGVAIGWSPVATSRGNFYPLRPLSASCGNVVPAGRTPHEQGNRSNHGGVRTDSRAPRPLGLTALQPPSQASGRTASRCVSNQLGPFPAPFAAVAQNAREESIR